jgi:hypothetical protein
MVAAGRVLVARENPMEPIQRTRAVLKLQKRNAPHLVALAQAIHDGMIAAAAQFPSPTPTMATFESQIQDLATAEQATKTKARGTAAVRNAKAAILVTSLESLQTYVQGLCDASPEQAATLISAAAMQVAAKRSGHKPILAAKAGPVSGGAQLFANRTVLVGQTFKRVLLNWQYSVDGGKTWVSAPSTPLASTEITGLPVMTTVSFRVSATVGKVVGDWSQAVAVLVR